MKTIIKVINNQEYICEQTNILNKNDFFIKEYIGQPPFICKILYIGSGIFQYKKLNEENSFGWEVFRSMTDISNLIGRKCNIELDVLYYKIIGIGFELN